MNNTTESWVFLECENDQKQPCFSVPVYIHHSRIKTTLSIKDLLRFQVKNRQLKNIRQKLEGKMVQKEQKNTKFFGNLEEFPSQKCL